MSRNVKSLTFPDSKIGISGYFVNKPGSDEYQRKYYWIVGYILYWLILSTSENLGYDWLSTILNCLVAFL